VLFIVVRCAAAVNNGDDDVDMSSVEAVPATDAEKARTENSGHQSDAVPLPGGTGRGQGIV